MSQVEIIANGSSSVTQLLMWVGLGFVFILVGCLAVFLAKRWYAGGREPDSDRAPESLMNYRSMRDRGEISEQEYAAIRDSVAHEAKRSLLGDR